MPNTTSLNEIIDILQRSPDKLGELLIEHSEERLRLLTRRMIRGYPHLRRWEDTDDILVEATIRLHQALLDVVPESPRHFFNLAALHVRRVVIEMVRKHFGPQGIGTNHETTDPSNPTPKHEKAELIREPRSLAEWTEFHKWVEDLPDEEQETFSLFWYEGLNQVEMARVLNIGLRTVKRRVRLLRLKYTEKFGS